jgi:hypothetical protein
MARKVHQYLAPSAGGPGTKAWQEARKAVGQPISRPGVSPHNARYNALRIARTESAVTYQKAAQDFYSDGVLSSGMNWLLSNTHANIDECDNLAKGSPYEHGNVPSKPHANCMCDVAPNLRSASDLKRKLIDLGYITS